MTRFNDSLIEKRTLEEEEEEEEEEEDGEEG
jgi:hypothetical protein